MDEKQMVPVWIFSVLFFDVLSDALEYLFSIFRCTEPKTSGHRIMDL